MRYLPIGFADWSYHEYVAIVRNLLLGRVHQGPDVQRLTQRLAKMYAPSDVHLLNYGHYAIEVALQVFKEKYPMRIEVVGPAYICPSVPNSVKRSGLQWRGVAVGRDLNINVDAMKDAIGDNTLAVIAPHMYGCAANIEAIERVCQASGVYLIDDAAQATGVYYGGRLLGTYGDVGILSFAQSKMVVTGVRGSGGGILINNSIFRHAIEERCAVAAPSSGRFGPVLDFIWNYLAESYTVNSGYYIQRLALMAGMGSKNIASMQMGNLESAVALVQLDRIESIFAHKRRVAEIYHQVLEDYPALRLVQYREGRALARLVVEVPEDIDLYIFEEAVAKQGIQLRKAYPIDFGVAEGASGSFYKTKLVGVPSGRGLTRRYRIYL